MPLDWDIVTPHYPPQPGGIADYTFILARSLVLHGDSVSVWCPQSAAEAPEIPGVRVYRVFQDFTRYELAQLNQAWASGQRRPRRILLMYHPHGFGRRSLNVPFCVWLWRRAARYGDRIVLLLHEYGLSFRLWKYQPYAAVHRVMLALALRSASQVWSPVEAWTKGARRWALGHSLGIDYLPVFSNIPVAGDAAEVLQVRRSILLRNEVLIGHFGTCPKSVTDLLDRLLPSLLRSSENRKALLIGSNTNEYLRAFTAAHPDLRARITATGDVSAARVSVYLRACDLLLQPYPDGINGRKSSAMAALANGVPIITTRGELSESFWQELDCVRTVGGGDAAKLISATEDLFRKPHLRHSMSIAAQSYYELHFTPQQIAKRLRECELGANR